jgi:hypothetical protein
VLIARVDEGARMPGTRLSAQLEVVLEVVHSAEPATRWATTRAGQQLFTVPVRAGQALTAWRLARELHPASGWWPVLVGATVPTSSCAAIGPAPLDGYQALATLAVAETTTAEAERDRRQARTTSGPSNPITWPAVPPAPDPLPLPDVVAGRHRGLLAFVPAEHGWQVPGILGWRGGTRYGLEPLEHVVTLRGWQRRYGAELVSLTGGQLLELLVADPPETAERAASLAREHAAYCPAGLSDQDAAAALIAIGVTSASWTFCWD